LEDELPAVSMGSKKSHEVHNSGGNGGGGGTKAETGDSCPTNSAADGSIMKVKGVVPAAFIQWILVAGVVVDGLARCIGEATFSTARDGEGDAIDECDGDLSPSEIESDDSGEISDSAYRRSAVPTVRRD